MLATVWDVVFSAAPSIIDCFVVVFLLHAVYLFCQCQAKPVDHVKKSYYVGDILAANPL